MESLENMGFSGLISDEYLEALDEDLLSAFIENDLAVRMKEADLRGDLFREQPFIMGVKEDGETLLVQGIIDAYFIENGEAVLVDYKTDKAKSQDDFRQVYTPQLKAYKKAIEAALDIRVKEAYIYSLELKEAICLDLND